jgi:hypothetical protein
VRRARAVALAIALTCVAASLGGGTMAARAAHAAHAAGSHAAAKDPAQLVVQLSDLPTGFTATSRRTRPNATVAKETGVPLATLTGWGRIGGFQAEYDRSVDPAAPPRGAATVSAAASTYRTAKGLQQAYVASVKRIAETPAARNVARAAPTGLGDGAKLWEARLKQDGVSVVLYTVVWRRAGTLSHVAVAGVAGRLTAADALAIARKQDARVRAAARPAGPGLVA